MPHTLTVGTDELLSWSSGLIQKQSSHSLYCSLPVFMQVPWGEASCLSWCVVHLQGPANCPLCHKHLLRAWDGRDVPSPRQLWNHTPFILCSSQPLYNSSTSLGEHCHSFQGLVKCWLSLPGASLLIWLYLVSIHFLPSTTYTPDQTPSYNCFFYKQMFTFLFISWDRGPYSPVGWFWTPDSAFSSQGLTS